MKNVLFCGPVEQADGWGGAAKDFVRALSLTSHNIATRPVYMSPHIKEYHSPLNNKIFNKRPDVVIQNVLPSMLDFQHDCKNIGLFHLETQSIKATGWIEKINLMDEIWVPTTCARKTLLKDGVNIPVHVIPTPIDTTLLDEEPVPFGEFQNSVIPKDDFVFYFVGEFITRKNLEALLVAFHREFHFLDPVTLFVKTHKTGMSSQDLANVITEFSKKVVSPMRLYGDVMKHHQELYNLTTLTPQNMLHMHKHSDCLVVPSHGECLNRPLMDAMYLGSDVIVTRDAGMNDLVKDSENGWLIDSHSAPCRCEDPPVAYLYTGREIWKDVDILDLQRCLSNAIKNKDSRAERAKLSKDKIVNNFSPAAVAKKMEECL